MVLGLTRHSQVKPVCEALDVIERESNHAWIGVGV